MRRWGLTSLSLVVVLAVSPGASAATTFTEIAADLGIAHTHIGDPTFHLGAGAAWLDFDNDGDYDLYLTDTGGGILYRNWVKETGEPAFTDVTLELGASDGGIGMSVTAVDYDNDGDQDLFLGNYDRNTLLQNQLSQTGFPSFIDVTEASGLDEGGVFTQSTAWGDFDADGDLDLFVTGLFVYENHPCGGMGGGPECFPDMLYRNEGDGTFTEIGAELGMNSEKCGLSAIWTDYDDDDDLDLWVGFDRFELTDLWRNDGPSETAPWTFTKQEDRAVGIASGISDMGISAGDINRDGKLDYFHAGAFEGNKLVMNNGNGTFDEISVEAGVHAGYDPAGNIVVSWGNTITDFDNDGWQDIYVVTGMVDQCNVVSIPGIQNLLYVNSGDGTFEEHAIPSGAGSFLEGRALAVADYDRDGDVDMFIGNPRLDCQLLRNDLYPASERSWLKVLPIGTLGNLDGIGAKVRIESQGVTQLREVNGGSSFLSMHSREQEFGLGTAEVVDTVTVRFVGGHRVTLRNVPVNQLLAVYEPTLEAQVELDRALAKPGDKIGFTFNAANIADYEQVFGVAMTLTDSDGVEHDLSIRPGPYTIQPEEQQDFNGSAYVPQKVAPGPAFVTLRFRDRATGRSAEFAYAEFEVFASE